MAATVIDLFSRAAYTWRHSAILRATRQRLGLTRAELAAVLDKRLNEVYQIRPGMIAEWEDRTEPPDEIVEACRALISGTEDGRRPDPPADSIDLNTSSDPSGLVLPAWLPGFDVSEADAHCVLAWVEATNTSDDAINYFTQAVARIAEEHASLPPSRLLAKAGQLHAMIWTLMNGGRQRQGQARELLRLDADLLAHLCQLLGDVRRDRPAFAYAKASVALAGEAGAGPAAAFSAQAQIARWRGRHAEAADLAAQGSRSGPPAHLHTLLAYQEANAAAAAGQRRRARVVLEHADNLESGSASYSAWSCPPARRALYRLGVALNLGEAQEALQLADAAEPMWESERPRAFGTWAHFQIAAAKAHVMLASPEGAAEQVAPVLGLSREYRISTLAAHADTLSTLLAQKPVMDSTHAVLLRDQLREFSHSNPTRTEN